MVGASEVTGFALWAVCCAVGKPALPPVSKAVLR